VISASLQAWGASRGLKQNCCLSETAVDQCDRPVGMPLYPPCTPLWRFHDFFMLLGFKESITCALSTVSSVRLQPRNFLEGDFWEVREIHVCPFAVMRI